jgi:uncharacterized membrane protein
MNDPVLVLTLVAVLGCGLVSGIFFAFSTFIMKALARLPAAEAIAAMQSINVAVLNRWFFAAFFGTAACCLVLAISCFFRWHKPGAIYLLLGSLLYLVGTIFVTIIFNVPLNNSLAAVDPASADAGQVMGDLCQKLDCVESCADGRSVRGRGFVYHCALSRPPAVRRHTIQNNLRNEVRNVS